MPDENKSNTPQTETPTDVGALHRRVDQLEEFFKHLVDKVDGWMGAAKPVVAAVEQLVGSGAAEVAHVYDLVIGGAPCPNHPDAPQTVAGCTVPDCTFFEGSAAGRAAAYSRDHG